MKRLMLSLAMVFWAISAQGQGWGWNIDWSASIFHNLGKARGVSKSGNNVFIATEYTGLRVMDVSNPALPTEVSWIDTIGTVYGVGIFGSHAYIASETSGFHVVDISNPANLAIVGSMPTTWPAYHLTASSTGDYVYVAAGIYGLRIVDVSEQNSPMEIGSISGSWNVRYVAVVDTLAYLGTDFALKIVNITDPANPAMVGELPTGTGPMTGIALDENGRAYLADGQSGLLVADVSDPAHPVAVDTLTQFSLVSTVVLADTCLYLTGEAGSGFSVYAFNVANPARPLLLGSCPLPEYAFGLTVEGNTGYIAEYYGLWLVGLTDPQNPQVIGSYTTPGYINRVVVKDSHAYLASYDAGVQVVNVSDPANPYAENGYITPGNALSLALTQDNKILVADADSGLRVLESQLPNGLHEIGSVAGYAEDVVVNGNYAYVARGPEAGVSVVDISNSANPWQCGFAFLLGYISDVDVRSPHVYAAAGELGLVIVNVSDPNNPTVVSPLMPGMTFAVAVVNDSIVYTSVVAGLNVYNVSDPAAPVGITTISLDAICGNLKVVQGYLYCAATTGIYVYNVVNPAAPLLVGSYDTKGVASGIDAFGSNVYVADGYNFTLLNDSIALPVMPEEKPQLPATFKLDQNHPNPFNPSTAISYQLPAVSDVNLAVYDIAGRLVATLVNSRQQSGTHSVTFNGTNLGSGVYIYRLTAEQYTASGKMVLMK